MTDVEFPTGIECNEQGTQSVLLPIDPLLFNHSISDKSREIREQVERRLYTMIVNWLEKHPRYKEAQYREETDYYVAQTFQHFWQVIDQRQERALASPAMIMQYLSISLNSVILDTSRSHKKRAMTGHADETVSSASRKGAELWESIRHLISDEREERLAYLLFCCGFRPQDIVCSFPQEFGDLREITLLRHRIITRLTF
jgi:hypothetical protein